jgi:hypothetical protein
MESVELEITHILGRMDSLSPDAIPAWGSMSAQRMIEHLSDTLRIASGKEHFPLEVPEDKLEKMILRQYYISDEVQVKEMKDGGKIQYALHLSSILYATELFF